MKLSLKLLVFILLTYNIPNCICSSNTDKTSEYNKISSKTDKNKSKKQTIKKNTKTNTKEENNNTTKENEDIEENDNNEEDKSNNEKEIDNNDEKDDNTNDKDNEEDTDNDNDDSEDNDEDDSDNNDNDEGGNDDDDETDGEEDEDDLNEEDDEDSIEEDDDADEDSTEDEEEEEAEDEYADKDPLEKLNRAIFDFNDRMNNILDKFSSNKNKSKPSPVSKAISNFSHNFFESPRIINYALQGNIENAANSIARLFINTLFGFFGVTDVAEKFGYNKKSTYFGDTLKKWGMKPGPYIVLPILGPTSLRGAVGEAFESMGPHRVARLPLHNLKPLPKNAIYYATYFSGLLATRSAYGDMIQQVSAMSKDKYKAFRSITMSLENS